MAQRWSHQFWLKMAQHYAQEGSKDPSTKVGCVIVRGDRTPASWGVNGFPMGIADTDERLNDRETKLSLTIHAEENAFAFLRERAAGYTLYSTFAPCLHCAAQTVQHGISHVVFYHSDNPRWKEAQIKSIKLFHEAGMHVTVICPETEETLLRITDSLALSQDDPAFDFYFGQQSSALRSCA